jgi:hypothetical protein
LTFLRKAEGRRQKAESSATCLFLFPSSLCSGNRTPRRSTVPQQTCSRKPASVFRISPRYAVVKVRRPESRRTLITG